MAQVMHTVVAEADVHIPGWSYLYNTWMFQQHSRTYAVLSYHVSFDTGRLGVLSRTQHNKNHFSR